MYGYAMPVNGYYGWGQWMAMDSETALEKYNDVSYNVNEARRLLEKAGYIYNMDGERYRLGQDSLRYRKEGAETFVPLEIRWAKTPGAVPDKLEQLLTPIFEQLGVKFSITEVSFADMLREYYRQGGRARHHNFYFLSSNFYQTFDPYPAFHTGDAWQGVFNTSGLRSEALMNAALALRNVSSDDRESYRLKWLEFQDAWHEEMPAAPIYSNVYADLCVPEVGNYHPSSHVGFGDAILYASYADGDQG
jgi:ABC-type transport system substrate-binding protein